jgi:nucleoid DNA-binding protein
MEEIEFGQSINVSQFIDYVIERMGGAIESKHIRSVILLLLKDLVAFLEEGNELDVKNLGCLSLKQYPSRKFHDLTTDKYLWSSGNKWISFRIGRTLRRMLAKHLDIEKTYGDEFYQRRSATEDQEHHKFWRDKGWGIDTETEKD